MTYSGIQMFMEKLKQLINCNDIPFFNHPSIICERPQFQLLYEDVGSMIQTLFIDQQQDLEKINDLKKRFTDAVEEAEYMVDVFLSRVHNRNTNTSRSFKSVVDLFLSCVHIRDLKRTLNLDDVRRSFKSVEVEFMKILDSSPRPQTTLNQSAAAAQSSTSRNSLGSKKLSDEIFVGIDGDAELIRDKLVEDQKKLDVVSIVGMGGIGKTTLATKVFNDGYVKHHFYVRVWVTVSQTYDKRDVLIQILESIPGQLDLEDATDSRLRELVHKNLMGKRYLIVIDDIWDIETWDNLKVFFPHDNNGSRILLTSRLDEVAKHANSDGFIHHLGCLNKETSWELLCQKVFQGNECPEWSIKLGLEIVESCQGLPLALVVIAGVLAKHAWSKRFWEEIAERTGSYIVGDQNGCMGTLALSYNRLPLHLRECFLYLGGFPEDYKFKVNMLIWLWVAEGFIEEDGNRSLEDIAKGYLMDLIDRNLVIVADRRKSNGIVKSCKMHDLVRELSLRKAKEERFILQKNRLTLRGQFSDVITQSFKPVRMFINENIYDSEFALPSAQNLRSILCFSEFISLRDVNGNGFSTFELLRVLDLGNHRLNNFPKGMQLLVHLRYLAIWTSSACFPLPICNLWNLQTLIYVTEQSSIDLPSNISDLGNLRHLWSFSFYDKRKLSFFLPSIERPMKNLQTISGVVLGDRVHDFRKCFPFIKELTCATYSEKENHFLFLSYLEKLKLIGIQNHITFPTSLKSLTLNNCGLPWSRMSIIHFLPNLHTLRLKHNAFNGSCWKTDKQGFKQLKFLKLEWLNMKLWEAHTTSFPCLKQLEIFFCKDLEEIPLEIGDIPTLELINIRDCNKSVGESIRRIEEVQHDLGNLDIKIHIFDY